MPLSAVAVISPALVTLAILAPMPAKRPIWRHGRSPPALLPAKWNAADALGFDDTGVIDNIDDIAGDCPLIVLSARMMPVAVI
jgi:hypothetical protein